MGKDRQVGGCRSAGVSVCVFVFVCCKRVCISVCVHEHACVPLSV